ncbi:hypothetical protein VNI00_012746 [Paramarasmius palmivorus]|uniref:Uncharacterized protein n=1 Tax=Paramarasmius palmivorus TaxID=297713 RepID=A0AAW0C2B2_9AGAR
MDALELAAERYSWLYMIHTLDETVKSAETNAFVRFVLHQVLVVTQIHIELVQRDLKERSAQRQAEEADIHDQRIRFQAERDIQVFDTLGKQQFNDAPSIIKQYLNHERTSMKIMNDAIDLSQKAAPKQGPVILQTPEHGSILELFNSYLDQLESLITDTTKLQEAITQLANSACSEHSQHTQNTYTLQVTAGPKRESPLHDAFSSLLPVLEARKGNLCLARTLLEGSKRNWATCVRMESLNAGS